MTTECPRCHGSKAVVEPVGGGWVRCPECIPSTTFAGPGFTFSADETVACAAALMLAATDPVFVGSSEVLKDPKALATIWAARVTAYSHLVEVDGGPDEWAALSNRLRTMVSGGLLAAMAERLANEGGPS